MPSKDEATSVIFSIDIPKYRTTVALEIAAMFLSQGQYVSLVNDQETPERLAEWGKHWPDEWGPRMQWASRVEQVLQSQHPWQVLIIDDWKTSADEVIELGQLYRDRTILQVT